MTTIAEVKDELGEDALRGMTGSDTVAALLEGNIDLEDAKAHALHVMLNKAQSRAHRSRPTEGVLDPAELRAGRAS